MKTAWITSVPLFLLITGCASAPTVNPTNNSTINTSSSTHMANSSASNSGSSNTANTTSTSHTQEPWATQVFIREGNYKTSEQEVDYPIISGLPNDTVQNEINARLKTDSIYVPGSNGDPVNDYQYTSTFNVLYQQGDIMNFLISSYLMAKGAAHGMPSEQSVIVNVKTGDSYTWKDIFNPGSNYLDQISKIVRNEDTKKVLDTFQPFTGVKPEDQFYLTPNGITVYFTPYEWASYAQGFLYYPVSYSRISNMMNKQGAFWNALEDTNGFQPFTNMIDIDAGKIQSLGYSPQANPTNSSFDVAQTNLGDGQNLIAIAGVESKNQNAEKVFFFLNTKYLGTDTEKAHGYVIGVSPNAHNTISVRYENPSYNGFFEINYKWDGSKLSPDKSFPSNYTWY